MAFNGHSIRYSSIVSPVEPNTFEETLFNSNQNYNGPLINTAAASNCTSDEEIARLEQERMYGDSLASVEPVRVPTPVDMRSLDELEGDAAFALRLQEEEYSRKSIMPNRSYASRGKPSSTVPQRNPGRTIMTDAELAAQLQEEENRKQRQHRLGARGAASRRGSNPTTNRFNPPGRVPFSWSDQPEQQSTTGDDDDDNDEPEIIPIPFPSRMNLRRAPPNRNNNDNNPPQPSDIFSMFGPLLAGRNAGGRRGGPRHLENTSDDFGPNDYENLLELDNSVGSKPLSANQINQLPTEKFRPQANKSSEDNTCNICWDAFEHNQTIRRLPCLHIYHQTCIDKWLKTNNTCPICRIPAMK